jgi:hypothetical protein
MLLLTDFLPVANLPFIAFIAMEATLFFLYFFETLLPFVSGCKMDQASVPKSSRNLTIW